MLALKVAVPSEFSLRPVIKSPRDKNSRWSQQRRYKWKISIGPLFGRKDDRAQVMTSRKLEEQVTAKGDPISWIFRTIGALRRPPKRLRPRQMAMLPARSRKLIPTRTLPQMPE